MTPVLEQPKRSFFTPLLISVVSLQLFSTVATVLLIKNVTQLQRNSVVYVQTRPGQVVPGHAAPLLHREPETIKTFAKEMIQGLFQYSIERELQASEEGFETLEVDGETVRIPLSMLQASYGLADDLQLPIVQQLGSAIPQPVIEGKEHYIVVFDSVSEPIQRESGLWEVQILGFQKVFREPNRISQSLPIKKRLLIKAVELPPPPRDGTSLEAAIYQIRSFGLEIHEIHEL